MGPHRGEHLGRDLQICRLLAFPVPMLPVAEGATLCVNGRPAVVHRFEGRLVMGEGVRGIGSQGCLVLARIGVQSGVQRQDASVLEHLAREKHRQQDQHEHRYQLADSNFPYLPDPPKQGDGRQHPSGQDRRGQPPGSSGIDR